MSVYVWTVTSARRCCFTVSRTDLPINVFITCLSVSLPPGSLKGGNKVWEETATTYPSMASRKGCRGHKGGTISDG